MSLLEELAQRFEELRPETLREPEDGDFIKYPYGVPAGYYEQLWDWDGFFICQHLANRPEDAKPEYYQYWVKNFIEAYRELGYPPGCITKEKPAEDRRAFPLKPFIAQAVHRGSGGDFEWVKDYYEDLVDIVTRREETNRDKATGLYFWDDAMQSGADNNAALSNSEELKGAYLACDLNAFQYEEYRTLSEVAWAVGNALHAAKFATEASNIKNAIQKHLWNENLGSFDNKSRETGCFVNCITYSNYVPLWAKLGTPAQAESMFLKYLLSGDHLMTPWGCRSLTRQDRQYNNANIIDPYSNWCGPIWPIANYFYFTALSKYGFYAEARQIANRLGRALMDDLNTNGSMHENYCGETGQPLAPSKDQGPRNVEGGFIGWNLLLQDMLEEVEKNEGLSSKQVSLPEFIADKPGTPAAGKAEAAPVEIPQPAGSSVTLDDINAAFLPKKKKEELY